MAYQLAAYAAVMAVSAIASGISGSNAAKRNARNTLAMSLYNSQESLRMGVVNANAITAATNASNAATWAVAQIGAKDTWDIAQYNADVRMLVGNYNSDVLLQEARYVWEAANADVTLLERDLARTKGNILTSYGASGAQINATDAVAMALTDAGTEAEINKFIVRHSADIQAAKIKNEAARSRWDGFMAAQQILYEGGMSSMGQYAQAGINIAGNTAQGRIDAASTLYNAQTQSRGMFYGGQVQAREYNAQASQAMTNGLFQAGASIASSYINSRMPTATAGSGLANGTARVSSYSPNLSIGATNYTSLNGSTYSASLSPIYTNQ